MHEDDRSRPAIAACVVRSRRDARNGGGGPATRLPCGGERALDRIVKRTDGDVDAIANIVGGRGDPKFRRTLDYTSVLTAPLIAAIIRGEKEAVARDLRWQIY
jgi:hypothetical protein